jgi:VanZ family protein
VSRRLWLPPVLWAAFILVLTSIPGQRLPHVSIEGIDKVVHLFCYGVLALLSFPAVAARHGAARAAVTVLLSIALFGALDEWHQQFIPDRSMDLLDWLADTFGGFLGVMAALVLARRAARS